MTKEDKSCFVISPIGDDDSETRRRSDQVLRHIIRPAVEACGYVATRADEIDKPGIITTQVIQRIVDDQLVVADLTESNPNVFYELAIRHAIRKPLIQMIYKEERIPFDVAGTRIIYFDHQDLDSVENTKESIIEQINSIDDDEQMETPISVSLDLQLLKQSEDPKERSLADLFALVSELRSSLNKLEIEGTSKQDALNTKKLLEELPRQIANQINISQSKTKERHLDRLMIRDLMESANGINQDISLLMILSLYREQLPWVYDIGLEAYKLANEGDLKGAREVIRSLREVIMLTSKSFWSMELFDNKEEYRFVLKELPALLDRYLMHF